jgi:proline dehydrogenase
MLAELRAAQSSGWVNQFLQEYRLNTSEGIALLSLAEAFLRVPDPETADQLIADKLGNADWRRMPASRIRPWSTRRPGAWSSAARWSARPSRRAR